MKTLVYGMQNSGASLFSFWLAQKEKCLAVIDLYAGQIAPAINHDDVIIKATVCNNCSIADHISSFQPDKVIAFVRNPIENLIRLSEKSYGHAYGNPQEKLEIMDDFVKSGLYDTIIKYEDFIMGKVQTEGHESNYKFQRTLSSVIDYNCSANEWCAKNYRKKWGTGNIHGGSLGFLSSKCPSLRKVYGE